MPAWLFVDKKQELYVFTNPTEETIPLKLKTPQGVLEIKDVPRGRLTLDLSSSKRITFLGTGTLSGVGWSQGKCPRVYYVRP